jgi:predicted house-cleaning noncanonical NTP pyrophosphatase (MazG superfamily)
MSQQSEEHNKSLSNSISFIFQAPLDEEIVEMDCNDYCEELAQIAELVARGASLEDLLPKLEEHMRYWTDCREEFDALVAVLKAQLEEDR